MSGAAEIANGWWTISRRRLQIDIDIRREIISDAFRRFLYPGPASEFIGRAHDAIIGGLTLPEVHWTKYWVWAILPCERHIPPDVVSEYRIKHPGIGLVSNYRCIRYECTRIGIERTIAG